MARDDALSPPGCPVTVASHRVAIRRLGAFMGIEKTPVAWLFAGQGSQTVGMGKDLADRYPSAARVFEEANDAIGIDLRALCFDGPQDELDKTANTQPALVAASIAAFRAAEEAGGAPLPEPAVVLGHSLGEFSALVAAGALRHRLIANVDGRVHEHAREMPALLDKQVWSPVQWVASVKRAHGEGASAFVEFGPGAVLTGLVKRILPDVMTGNVSDESTLRQSLPLLKGDAL